MAIDLDTEIEAARQDLAELDRLRGLAEARLTAGLPPRFTHNPRCQ